MRGSRAARRRTEIARHAARLMYDGGVGQYYDAKRLAANACFGRKASRRLRFRPADLPSNGEIRAALLALARRREGPACDIRLRAMRQCALEVMDTLADFHPRLIGSVASGFVHKGSDIDLHVFVDDPDELIAVLDTLRWPFESEHVLIRVGDSFREFLHLHLERAGFPVELSVYPPGERRKVGRSSIDGKPIDRVSPSRLRGLLDSP